MRSFRRRARLLTGGSALGSGVAPRKWGGGGRRPASFGRGVWEAASAPRSRAGHPRVAAAAAQGEASAALAALGDALPLPSAAALFPSTSSFLSLSSLVFPSFSSSLLSDPLFPPPLWCILTLSRSTRLALGLSFLFLCACVSRARAVSALSAPFSPSTPESQPVGVRQRIPLHQPGGWTWRLPLRRTLGRGTSFPSPQPRDTPPPGARGPPPAPPAGRDGAALRGSEPPEPLGPRPEEMLGGKHPPQGTRLLAAGSLQEAPWEKPAFLRVRLRGGGVVERPQPEACAQGHSALPQGAEPRLSRFWELKVPAQAFYGILEPPPNVHQWIQGFCPNENMSIVCKWVIDACVNVMLFVNILTQEGLVLRKKI